MFNFGGMALDDSSEEEQVDQDKASYENTQDDTEEVAKPTEGQEDNEAIAFNPHR